LPFGRGYKPGTAGAVGSALVQGGLSGNKGEECEKNIKCAGWTELISGIPEIFAGRDYKFRLYEMFFNRFDLSML
jgi:hypothetical protein